MFNPSRQEARQFFFETWHKYHEKQTLTDLEKMLLGVLMQHPEYHPVLDQPDRFHERDYLPEWGDVNPFLHMSMHLAIAEQLSIDQPAGIKALYQQALAQQQDAHAAEHMLMDGLAEMIWQAQRKRTGPDATIYFDCVRLKLGLT
jgi:hypothetical protein